MLKTIAYMVIASSLSLFFMVISCCKVSQLTLENKTNQERVRQCRLELQLEEQNLRNNPAIEMLNIDISNPVTLQRIISRPDLAERWERLGRAQERRIEMETAHRENVTRELERQNDCQLPNYFDLSLNVSPAASNCFSPPPPAYVSQNKQECIHVEVE